MFARRNPHTAGRRRDTGLFRTARDLVATLVGIVVLLVALDRLGAVSIPFMLQWWPFLVTPATTALGATTIAFAVGFVIAIPLGLVRAYGSATVAVSVRPDDEEADLSNNVATYPVKFAL